MGGPDAQSDGILISLASFFGSQLILAVYVGVKFYKKEQINIFPFMLWLWIINFIMLNPL